MSELKALNANRGYVKGSLTRISKFCESEEVKTCAIEILSEKRDRLAAAFDEYEVQNRGILLLDPSDKEDYGEYEDLYYKSVAVLDYQIKMRRTEVPVNKEASTSTVTGEFNKLPRITIPGFDGKNVVDYYPFINLFRSVIHSDKRLSACEKLYYLRSLLCGEALDIIKNLPLNDISYDEALKLLDNRYDNTSKIVNFHINSMLDLPTFTKCTAQSLRTIISNVNTHLAALKNLEQPVQHWDSLLINILAKKVDNYTIRGFHLDRNPKEVPTLSQFLSFLEKRAIAQENTGEEGHAASHSGKASKSARAVSGVVTSKATCKYCSNNHRLFECAKFKMASEKDRCEFVKNKNLCTICLNEHSGKCMLRLKCNVCQQRHNTLVHMQSHTNKNEAGHMAVSNSTSEASQAAVNMTNTAHSKDVLLPTAIVRIKGKNGAFINARALLDSGSQISFITEGLAGKIGCDSYEANQKVLGILDGIHKVSKQAKLTIYSSVNDFSTEITCCIVNHITCKLPQQSFDITKLNIPPHIKLADRNFNQAGEIDILIGCDIFFQVLQRESLPATPSGPYLVNTAFGYVVAGSLPVSAGKVYATNLCIHVKGNNVHNFPQNAKEQDPQLREINENISKLWECEKVPTVYKEGTSEHQLAEQCFQSSVQLRDRKFSVGLPLKLELENVQLGNSFSYALQRFYNLEKRFAKDELLSKKYKEFIKDYVDQGHAKDADIQNYNLDGGQVYFLPHHPVFNPNSKTTPVRAVFDASMKTKNGLCLNDILLNGPVVQNELFDILTLFRTYKFVLLCDIKAMYRGVLLKEEFCCFQNILWRDSTHDPVRCLQLQTVTYGVKSSAFLATRCLMELAQIYQNKYPLAASALKYSTYVDDIQVGSNELSELEATKSELIDIMQEASFSLHKWCSNDRDVLKDIPSNLQCFGDIDFDKNNLSIKTLGLTYDVACDTLNMKCPEKEVLNVYTKRQMLSFISKFFDPLGLVGPLLVQAKYLMQQVWFADIKWDDTLPEDLNKRWVEFAKELVELASISIPRNINVQSSNSIELVGYADASNIAYGCCLYLRAIDEDNVVKVNLLCSRSRINPKNKKLTTPRLELNSALLLAMLAKKVHDTLSIKYVVRTFLYLDSQIVLAWLNIAPVRLSVYVANRVEKINQLAEQFEWNYVKSSENPADCLSRGMSPKLLETEVGKLWFHGPEYLHSAGYIHFKKFDDSKKIVPELKPEAQICNTCNKVNNLISVLDKYSNIEKLTRVISYVKRFINNCKKENVKRQGKLCPEELTSALHAIIGLDQGRYFQNEIKQLKEHSNLAKLKTNLSNLNPFLDSSSLLRIGGRLQNANLSYSQRHPIILQKGSHITKLIILNEHLRLKHAGQKLILCSLNERYWIINASREIKSVIHKCIICFKLKAKATTQLMGSLPSARVNVTRPFQIIGTDYGGPFNVKQSRIRSPVITKAYIVIFVCFVTKAIHIELASDMTTNTFLACLKRFISRRNKPTKIYSDNAAYYKGASNVLNDLYKLQNSTSHQEKVQDFCNAERISFHFIPSYSPVFGGLWEAGIKSVKYHIKRVIGQTVLTYEELYTVLVQIEGILNSRPLTPMTADQEDMSYLSPAHFLTGSSLSSYPELNLVGENVGKLSFWKQCVQMQQSFWHQWHKQYLVMLQSRPKWKGVQPNLEIGTMVIIKNENVAPLQWPIGRIVAVMPGKDGKVRALSVKTAKGSIITTSIMKVCPLPLDN